MKNQNNKYIFGIGETRYSVSAPSLVTAKIAMVFHYMPYRSNAIITIYSPIKHSFQIRGLNDLDLLVGQEFEMFMKEHEALMKEIESTITIEEVVYAI